MCSFLLFNHTTIETKKQKKESPLANLPLNHMI